MHGCVMRTKFCLRTLVETIPSQNQPCTVSGNDPHSRSPTSWLLIIMHSSVLSAGFICTSTSCKPEQAASSTEILAVHAPSFSLHPVFDHLQYAKTEGRRSGIVYYVSDVNLHLAR